jgi:hypothetical protein
MPTAEGPGDPARLLTVLAPDDRAAWAAEFIAAHGLSDAFRILGSCTVPWSEPLGRAVVDALEIARDAGSYPELSMELQRGDAASTRLRPIASRRWPRCPTSRRVALRRAGGYWAEAFQRLDATLRIRRTMQDELTPGPPALPPTR